MKLALVVAALLSLVLLATHCATAPKGSSARSLLPMPPLDAKAPAKVETATFAFG